jgi:acyl carrier protein
MSEQLLLKELCEVVADKLGVPLQDVQETSAFSADLGADSLDMAALMMELEDRYSISISEQEVGDLVTLGDAARFLYNRLLVARSCTES